MDHKFRASHKGLETLGEISEEGRSREEFGVIIDSFAMKGIGIFVPIDLQQELIGWARCYHNRENHVEAIKMYGAPKLPEPKDEAWNTTKQHTLTLFQKFPKISPMSYNNFDCVTWLPSSAAGYGYVGRKGDGDNYSRAKRAAVAIAEKLDQDQSYGSQAIEDSTPDIAFTRMQLPQIKVRYKPRAVWAEAFHYVLLEGLFADPLIQSFKKTDSFYFIGRTPLLSVPLPIMDSLIDRDFVYMFDWYDFDSSVQEWELRFAFQCLEAMLSFPSNVEYQIWCFLIELFIYRKIVSPTGVLHVKTHGIPSGSCFANIISSITNYVRIQYIFYRLTNQFGHVYTHGDDGLAAINSTELISWDRFNEICVPLNWKIKYEVSNELDQAGFLSRSVKKKQKTRDELVCLRMLAFPEYHVTSADVSVLRAMDILFGSWINTHYSFMVAKFLKDEYWLAHSFPYEYTKWDPYEYEARQYSASLSL